MAPRSGNGRRDTRAPGPYPRTMAKGGIFKKEALVLVLGRIAWPFVALAVGYVVLRVALG